jgi:hypothetical protein
VVEEAVRTGGDELVLDEFRRGPGLQLGGRRDLLERVPLGGSGAAISRASATTSVRGGRSPRRIGGGSPPASSTVRYSRISLSGA